MRCASGNGCQKTAKPGRQYNMYAKVSKVTIILQKRRKNAAYWFGEIIAFAEKMVRLCINDLPREK